MSLPLIPLDSLLLLTQDQVAATVNASPRRRIGEITLMELAHNELLPNGAYVFYRPGEKRPLYVGRCASRSFLGRIPLHFEPDGHWMNTLSRAVKKLSAAEMKHHHAVLEALQMEVVLIGVRMPEAPFTTTARQRRIADLELVLQECLQPIANPRPVSQRGGEVLGSVLQKALTQYLERNPGKKS